MHFSAVAVHLSRKRLKGKGPYQPLWNIRVEKSVSQRGVMTNYKTLGAVKEGIELLFVQLIIEPVPYFESDCSVVRLE